MRVLVDTHALHWYIEGDKRLSQVAGITIQDAANEVFISPASFWEIAIKVDLGKWKLEKPYAALMDLALVTYGFQILPISVSHTNQLIGLPYPEGHRDPFDRLLVAQCLAEGLPLVSCDTAFDLYPFRRLWA